MFELGAAGELVNTSYEHLPGMRIQNVLNDHSILQWLSQNSYLYSFAFNTAYEAAKRLLLSRKRQPTDVMPATWPVDVAHSFPQ